MVMMVGKKFTDQFYPGQDMCKQDPLLTHCSISRSDMISAVADWMLHCE